VYPTKYWEENYNKYKGVVSSLDDDKKGLFYLSFLALKFYSLPTSEAYIERLFSVLKYILGKRRLSLHPALLLALLRLRGIRLDKNGIVSLYQKMKNN
jgi:hypothetical protein